MLNAADSTNFLPVNISKLTFEIYLAQMQIFMENAAVFTEFLHLNFTFQFTRD